MQNEEIVPGAETYPRSFVGKCIAFDLTRPSGKVTREKGEITHQRFLGFTKRGQIPEYEVTILGNSGRSVLARITRDHVSDL